MAEVKKGRHSWGDAKLLMGKGHSVLVNMSACVLTGVESDFQGI